MSGKQAEERPLTEAEQRRVDLFQRQREAYEARGYRMVEMTASVSYANVMALVLMLPLCAVLAVFYMKRNGTSFPALIPDTVISLLALLAALAVLTVLHEGVHGVTWGLFAPDHMRSIEFGFIKEQLTPYCTCKEPLKKFQYILGAAMPLLVVGLIPSVLAIFLGSAVLLWLGVIMVFGAGGDVWMILKILGHRTEAEEIVYLDHPTKVGLVTFEK